MVKCTTCGARWRAFQDRSEPEEEVPEDDLLVEGPPAEPAPSEPAPSEDDLEFVAAPVTPVRKPARKTRPLAQVVGVSLAAVLVVTAGAVVLLRQQIADVAPGTAPLFAAIGLPVNTLGLVFEGVKSKAMLQGGRPVWSVTGAVRNVRDEPVTAPPIRISLFDGAGKPVANLVADVLNARVPPGAVRYFAVTLPEPPANAEELEVSFQPRSAAAPTEGAPLAAATLAPEPAEAQALPSDSPHALEKHVQP